MQPPLTPPRRRHPHESSPHTASSTSNPPLLIKRTISSPKVSDKVLPRATSFDLTRERERMVSNQTEREEGEDDDQEGEEDLRSELSHGYTSTAQTSPEQISRSHYDSDVASQRPSRPLRSFEEEEDDASFAARSRPDVTDWAPKNQLPVFPKLSVSHLPDFLGQGSDAPTSLPIGPSQVQMEMSEAVQALLSEEVFADLMKDRLGRHRFREYLINTRGDVASLDLWIDLTGFRALTHKVRSTAIALNEVFVMGLSANLHPVLTSELREDVVSSLRQGIHLGDSLDAPQQHLLHNLYTNEFQAFIKYKLIEESHVRLGQLDSLPGTGLGDAFCLTNPRLRDHPITLISPGFERLTGYTVGMIAGRNCRMLAGPATSPVTSKRIHDALSRGEGINTLVLNYRRDGTPFFNLLCIIPLRDTYGHLTYFLGGQTEVTGSLAAGKSLSWLVGSDADPASRMSESDFSPTYQAYASAISMGAKTEQGLDPIGIGQTSRAGGEVPGGRSQTFGAEGPSASTSGSDKRGSGLKTFLQSLGVAKKKSDRQQELATGHREGQQIGGAESLFSKHAAPVQIQIAQFANVYSKVFLFRRATRQIIFVTADFLAFCGLPNTKPSQIFNSDLIHQDVLSILTAPERGDTKATRKALKEAIGTGVAKSLPVGVKYISRLT